MKNILNLKSVASAAFTIVSLCTISIASALTVPLPGGGSVNVDANGNSNVNLPGQTINTNANGDSVNVQYGSGQGLGVTKSGTSTYNVTTPGQTIQVSPGSAHINRNGSVLNVDADGQTVHIETSSGLNLHINHGDLNQAAKDAIVSLQGGTDALIQTNQDLQTYNQLVLGACPTAQNVSASDSNDVSVQYSQPAKFLGLFNMSLTGTAHVAADGTVNVQLPWYAFLFGNNASHIESAIKSNVANDNQTPAVANAAATDVTLRPRLQAHLLHAVVAALFSNIDNCVPPSSGTPTPTPAPTQTPTPAPQPTSAPTPTPTQATTPTPAPQPSPAPQPTPQPSVLLNFKGDWNGTYTRSPLADSSCAAGDAVSLTVHDDGSVVGYAMYQGVQMPGTATVNSNGRMSGTWVAAGYSTSFSGTLNTNTNSGSGTYQNTFGCFGTFSVSR